jgi:hypothetical protein
VTWFGWLNPCATTDFFRRQLHMKKGMEKGHWQYPLAMGFMTPMEKGLFHLSSASALLILLFVRHHTVTCCHTYSPPQGVRELQ